MKKIPKNLAGFVFSCNIVFLASCNKNKATTLPADPEPVTTDIANGLPDNPKKINGYAFAENVITYNNGSPNPYVYLMALFGDPARNLIANYDHFTNSQRPISVSNDRENVSVGTLSFNGVPLYNGGSVIYQQNSTMSNVIYNSANWLSDGNLSFKPINTAIPRGFPIINHSTMLPTTYSISLSKDFSIDFSNFISNYDSVSVSLSSSSFSQYQIKKTLSSASNSITFSKTELSVLYTTTYGNITFAAFNYSNKIIEDKIYVFELSNRINMTLVISQ